MLLAFVTSWFFSFLLLDRGLMMLYLLLPPVKSASLLDFMSWCRCILYSLGIIQHHFLIWCLWT